MSYHGNMTIHDDIICNSYEDAKEKIDSLDKGFYDDHAVKYYESKPLKETTKIKFIVNSCLLFFREDFILSFFYLFLHIDKRE